MVVLVADPVLPHPRVRHRLLLREVNERIRELNASFGAANGNFDLVCECAREECVQRIKVRALVYERARKKPGRFVAGPGSLFVVADGHELGEIDNVVEHHGDCLLVENRGQAGVAAKTAEGGVLANVIPAAEGDKRESDDPDAEDPPSPDRSNADRAKEREREMEESGEELPG